jgi:hypothetical protein
MRKEEPKQRLEKYSERFDNDESAIGNPETWGRRLVKEKPKQETLEEAAEIITTTKYSWEQERSYSEGEVKKIAFDFYYNMSHKMNVPENLISENMTNVDVWFEQLKNK